MKKLLLLLGLLAFAGCVTDEDETRGTLEKSGFSHISTGDVSFMACSKEDKPGREFTAVNANGVKVSGVVCCGVFKSCTVRF